MTSEFLIDIILPAAMRLDTASYINELEAKQSVTDLNRFRVWREV
jgi:hypothetical protein